MHFRNQIIKANHICDLCKKYNIKWKMDLGGVTVYYSKKDTSGKWFPLACVENAEELILELANADSVNQSTLNDYL